MSETSPLAGRRILLTGAGGLLGFALTRELREAGACVAGVWSTRPVDAPDMDAHRCDLREAAAVRALFDRVKPACVVHAAALTDLSLCEREPQLAHAVNAGATATVAAEATRAGAAMIYVSSESVYGDGPAPHRESDACQPLSVYARTKLEGEEQALRHAPGALVLRTTIVGTAPSAARSLVAWLLGAFQRGTPVRGFQDVIFSPLFTHDFSRLLIAALGQKLEGIWNVGAGSRCSKFHFARLLAESLGFDPELVQPGRLADAALTGPRCYQSALVSDRFAAKTGAELPTVEVGIARFAAAHADPAVSHS